MKEIKTDRWVCFPRFSPPTIPIPIRFKFTAEETKDLETTLKRFDKDKVRNFLFTISLLPMIPLFVAFKERTFPKDAIEGHLNNLSQCRKTIEKILRGFDPDPQRDFSSIYDPKIRLGQSPWAICFENAEKAYPHIKAIEETLQALLAKAERRRGKPQADQDGFVLEVAKLYKRTFEREPSKAKKGIFCDLINKLFGIVFPKEDVYDKSKTVERALDKLKAG